MADWLWADILAGVNCLMGLLIGGLGLQLTMRGERQWRWLYGTLTGLGFYWGMLYLVVLIVPNGVLDPVWFGRIFVRPAFTLTLGVILAGIAAMVRFNRR